SHQALAQIDQSVVARLAADIRVHQLALIIERCIDRDFERLVEIELALIAQISRILRQILKWSFVDLALFGKIDTRLLRSSFEILLRFLSSFVFGRWCRRCFGIRGLRAISGFRTIGHNQRRWGRSWRWRRCWSRRRCRLQTYRLRREWRTRGDRCRWQR